MANTYTWDFPALDTAPSEDGLSDVIKTIHWRITAVDDNGITASAYGSVSPELDPDNFVAFDSVTKDWCKEKVLASLDKTEAEMQETLDTQIDNLANPPMVSKVPASW